MTRRQLTRPRWPGPVVAVLVVGGVVAYLIAVEEGGQLDIWGVAIIWIPLVAAAVGLFLASTVGIGGDGLFVSSSIVLVLFGFLLGQFGFPAIVGGLVTLLSPRTTRRSE